MRKIKSKVLGALIKSMMAKADMPQKEDKEPKEACEEEDEGKGSISILIAHGKAKKG